MAGPWAPWIFPVSLAPGAPWAPASLARLRSRASRNLGCTSSAGAALSRLSSGCSGLAALLAMEASCRGTGTVIAALYRHRGHRGARADAFGPAEQSCPPGAAEQTPSPPEEAWRALGIEATGPPASCG